MTDIIEKAPNDFENIGTVMSNFDLTVEPGMEKHLKNHKVVGNYPAWGFHGTVWHDGVFKCQIKRFGSHVATITGNSLQDIMDSACEQFGDD